jgi:DNA-binding transcriptional regulator YiaG
MTTEDDRLVRAVRRMAPQEFTRRFRDGLPASALVRVVAALPAERLDELAEHVQRSESAAPSRPPGLQTGATERPLAVAIRNARRQASMSQGELAERLGIRQSSISQWERGTTGPTARRLVELMNVLPSLADGLSLHAMPSGGMPHPSSNDLSDRS